MRWFLLPLLLALSAHAATPDFSTIYRVLDERCLECHAKDDYEGGLILEDHASLMKGGENGAAVVPGKSAESLLMKYLRGEVVKDGKKKFMPPGKREKLSPEEIALFASWIDAGAQPALAAEKPRELVLPKIAPKTAPRLAINSLAYDPAKKLLAIGRFGALELLSVDTRQSVRKLEGLKGNVNAIVFSADGSQVFAASGENALFGEVKQWNVADGKLVCTIQGHRDTIYGLALSPDGKLLATGSYDQQIKLWNVADGSEVRTLRGHNGAVYAVAFRPDGAILASASADRTVKLWDVATGQRRETFSQPTKEQVALAWSADGKRLAAGGGDNRIRVWEVSPEAKETTNPLVVARYAHEGSIMRLLWSADGKTLLSSAQDGSVKLWDGDAIKERLLLERQPDWPSALAFTGATVVAGRLNGTLGYYNAATGATVAPPAPPKPPESASVLSIEPRGVERGQAVKVKLIGKGLVGLKSVSASNPKVMVTLQPGATAKEAWVEVRTPGDLRRGEYNLTVTGADGKPAAPVPFFVDNLPQVSGPPSPELLSLPASRWGTLTQPGVTDRIRFGATAGETLVFDLASQSLGSKATAAFTLVDPHGRVLATHHYLDKMGEPLVAYTFAEAGEYTAEVSDAEYTGSPEHFYRLSVGAFPFVTACFPLSVPAHQAAEVELAGFNLPPNAKVAVPASEPGEMALPLDPEKYRARRDFKLSVRDLPQTLARETAGTAAAAMPMAVPGFASGRLREAGPNYYRFEAKAGSQWIVETSAAQRGAPTDTKIEVLDATGHPIERMLLQAVRDSAITFRAIDSAAVDARVDNWREMELNQLLYMNGEVAKIFRMPEGPDSGFQFYKGRGGRIAYFDTTATAHSLDEPCYIVEPHPPGTKLIANGLPVFPVYYTNDDDGSRRLGTDSSLTFTAPKDGTYLVAVSESRGHSGDRYAYDLIVRPPRPDFTVLLTGLNPDVNAGSGQGFSLVADRQDGFDGDVKVEISGLPAGWKVTSPLLIQAGHEEARGTVSALAEAKPFTDADFGAIKINATAEIGGASVSHPVMWPAKLKVMPAPAGLVALEPAAPSDTVQHVSAATPLQPQQPDKPFEITIAPGETIPAWIKVKRAGKSAEIRFDVDDLPHGVIVDNLGLNGITLLTGQDEGEIHLKADPWVAEMDRPCFAITRGLGAQTSLPVILHVRKKATLARGVQFR